MCCRLLWPCVLPTHVLSSPRGSASHVLAWRNAWSSVVAGPAWHLRESQSLRLCFCLFCNDQPGGTGGAQGFVGRTSQPLVVQDRDHVLFALPGSSADSAGRRRW